MRIDGARDERLGELVRRLVSERPETDVLLDAPALASAPEGSVVVLRLRAEDRTWLNLARPVVAQRALRLILWSDAAATAALVHGAIDFFDWISHRVECPAGPPDRAARALRRVLGMRAPAVAWWGTGFEGAFQMACPGRRLVPISGALPYSDLVGALRPEPRTWVAVTDVDGEDRLQRMRWASAEARRWGRTVLVNPLERAEVPGVDARTMELDEAAARLRAAGAERPARLAALVNLSERSVETVCGWLASGIGEAEIEGRVSAGGEVRAGGVNEGEGWADRWPRWLPEYGERVRAAMEVGDYGVARRWAAGWAEAEPERAEAWIARAEIHLRADDLEATAEMIESARARLGERRPRQTDIDLAGIEAAWQYARGRIREALDTSVRGIQVARGLGARQPATLWWRKMLALLGLGRDALAWRILEDWTREAARTPEPIRSRVQRERARAMLLRRRGDPQAAINVLDATLAALPALHEAREGAEVQKALAEAELGRSDEALRALDSVITRQRRVETPVHEVLRLKGRVLHEAGRLEHATRELKAALGTSRRGLHVAETLLLLARCQFGQGRVEEAQSTAGRAHEADAPVLLSRILALQGTLAAAAGQADTAASLLTQALAEHERMFPDSDEPFHALLGPLASALLSAGQPRAAEVHLRRKLHIAARLGDLRGQAEATHLLARAQRALGFPQAAHTQRRADEIRRLVDAAGLRPQDPLDLLRAPSPL